MQWFLAISSIIGGIIDCVLTTLLISPVTAQRNKFDTIECSRLKVVDNFTGKPRVIISGDLLEGDSYELTDYGLRRPKLPAIAHMPQVYIGSFGHGGIIMLYPTETETAKATVKINSAHDNGYVSVRNSKNQSRATLSVSSSLGGCVTIHNNNDEHLWQIGYPPGPLTNPNNEP